MVQLNFLSGKNAGAVRQVRRFPCLAGRGSSAHLRLEEPGIWDKHFQFELEPKRGVTLRGLPGASTLVNGQQQEKCLLRNGDIIEAGAVRLQFWLSPTRQRHWKMREILTWWALVGLTIGEICLIYALQR